MKSLKLLILCIILLFEIFLIAYEIDSDKVKEIYELSFEELMEVKIVTAGKNPQKVQNTPASITIITRDEIARFGYVDIYDILRNVPGVYEINSRAFPGVSYGIRGYWTGWQRNFVVLIDNVEQENSYGLFHMQNANIPVEAIERIEIVRGPMSIMYGSNAFLGAINIITKANDEDHNIVSSSYGTENTKRIFARSDISKDDLFITFNAGFYETDGLDEPLSKMVSDMSSLDVYGISEENDNLTTEKRLENKNLSFNVSGAYNDFFFNFSTNQSEREEYHFWPTFSDGLVNIMDFITVQFGLDKELNNYSKLKLDYKYIKSNYWREFDYFEEDFYGQELDLSNHHKYEINYSIKPLDQLNILSGITYSNKDRKTKLDLRDVYLLNTGGYWDSMENLAFFTQINFNYREVLSLYLSGRIEKQYPYSIKYFNNEAETIDHYNYELDDYEILPGFSAIYKPYDNLIVKLLYGKAVKIPISIDVTHQLISEGSPLESEYIETFEVNVITEIMKNARINASIYRNNLDNLLTQFLQFDNEGNWSPIVANSGEMVTNGVEISLNAKISDNLIYDTSASYQKTTNKINDLEDIKVGYSPELLFKNKATYLFSDNTSLSLIHKYVDEMETLWDVAIENEDGSFGKRLGQKVDAYSLFDLNFRVEDFIFEKLYINLKGMNIFDKEYLYPVYTSNRIWIDKGMIGDRRSFYLTTGYRF